MRYHHTVSGLILSGALGLSHAGPLDPPAPPAPTAGEEARIPVGPEATPGNDEALFVISAAGSYYLTGHVVAPNGLGINGIMILADSVTLDLNGFTVDGFGGVANSTTGPPPAPNLTGILASGGLTGLTVRNGHVRDWGESGIDMLTGQSSIVEGISTVNNGEIGIRVGGGALISGCTARDNGADGIRTSVGSTVTNCTSVRNDGVGIAVSQSSTVQTCVALSSGSSGISTSNDSSVIDCVSYLNDGSGIVVNGSCLVDRCTSNNNDEDGIVAGNSLVTNCIASNNGGAGINLFSVSGVADGNVVRLNARGIEAGSQGNTVTRNRADGISQDHYGSIVGGNDLGTVRTSPVGADPWDNFEF